MTVLWIILAFISGCVFWYHAGGWMLKRALRDSAWTKRILRDLKTDSLIRLNEQAEREIAARKQMLS